MTIETRPLGRTGAHVTVLGYGAMELRGQPAGPAIEDEDAGRLLNAVLDGGINLRRLGTDRLDLPNLPGHIAMGVFDAFQIPYSAVQREHEDLITAAVAAGAGTPIRGGAARGGPDKDWRQCPLSQDPGVGQRRWEASGVADLLDGMPGQEFMLRFTRSHPDLSSTIVGTSSLDHLRSNLEMAARGPLPAGQYEQARQLLSQAAPGESA